MDQNNPYFMEERRKLIQSIIQKEKESYHIGIIPGALTSAKRLSAAT